MQPDREYEVGYKKPPKHTQWKKGHCPNPNGRSRKKHSFESALGGALHEKVAITENGRRRKINKGEAVCKSVVNAAATGDLKAAALLVRMMEAIGRHKKQRPAPETTSGSTAQSSVVILPHNHRDPMDPELVAVLARATDEYYVRKEREAAARNPANENHKMDVA